MKVNRIYKGFAITKPFGVSKDNIRKEIEKRISMVGEVLMMLTS